MGKLVFICGESGSGKSTSMRNLDPKSTYIINSDAKDLPFKGASKIYNKDNKNYAQISDPKSIVSLLLKINEAPHINTVIVDTWSRTMTDSVMASGFRKTSGFEKWSQFAGAQYDLLNTINNVLRSDLIVYLFSHLESYYSDSGLLQQRVVVQGKQLEKYVPESFSSIVLYTHIESMPGKPNEFYFRTVTNGADTCKTPIDLFNEELIPNDLVLVNNAIKEYYG